MSEDSKLSQEQAIRAVAVREANYYFGFTRKSMPQEEPVGLSVVLDHAQYIEAFITDGTLPVRSADLG